MCVAAGLISPVPAQAAIGAEATAAIPATGVKTAAASAMGTVPSGFSDDVVLDGLNVPTAAAFADDGRVFIAEKSGIIKTFDGLTDTTATVAADLRDDVYDYWDRGLLGMTVHPDYPTKPYLYALYSLDRKPGGGQWGDACPNPPGANDQGCVIKARLSRLTLDGNGVATDEQPLLTGWCQQYPSHSIGTVAFGPDGALYVGSGDGASFTFTDFGQEGNPCGDPPEPAGTSLTAPDARGGALRSQSARRPAGDPISMDGSILRVDPDTGDPLPDNPFASSGNAKKQRIIAYGMRNPFRFSFRPGTGEIWAGDVGWRKWEEINRIPGAGDTTAENFGWPCYEGGVKQPGYNNADLTACESLYTGAGQDEPYFAYHHQNEVVAGDNCGTGGSSISGIAFEDGTSDYPLAYRGALFFADSSRGCVWAMRRGIDGQPDPGSIELFAGDVVRPVQLLIGPGSDLYYIALDVGELHRISYNDGNNRPNAVASASPTSGPAPLTVDFDGTASTDPDTEALSYAWDLDGDGAFDDASTATAQRTYLHESRVRASLRVTDPRGLSDVDTVTITVGNPPDPTVTIDSPTSDLTWRVGETISFSGHAEDPQDGPLPADSLDWQLTLRHCTTIDSCHSHAVQLFRSTASGSFSAPDHDYPSYLELTLIATDSDGNSSSETVRLDPETVWLDFDTEPSGLDLNVGDTERTPFSRRVIVGSRNTIAAPNPQEPDYWFTEWSDGGKRGHDVFAPASRTTYTATYISCTVDGVKQPDCGEATPSAVRDLEPIGRRAKAKLSWREPYWPGHDGVTKYRIHVDGEFVKDVGPGKRRTVVRNLATRQSYSFRVTPYSAAGPGPGETTKLIGTTVRSRQSSRFITYGDTVRVRGAYTRTDTGGPVRGASIRLVGRPPGEKGWRGLSWQKTNKKGIVAFPRKTKLNWEYRLIFYGNRKYMGVTSAWHRVTVRQRVRAFFSDPTPYPGERVRLYGRVLPNHEGKWVRIQLRENGEWVTAGNRKLSATSRYRFAIRWNRPGDYYYRVWRWRHHDHGWGVSPVRKLKVRWWHD
ncbi:PQQ-dependent sugar dehydrogenase [Haloechinothrix salitolerans]|uniref:PQQ-dependent sugar dehydrogenase n=1 Tax=Haloechinothrix salitolerans TaxID=926830 RepID=A0ABW2BUD3_9PSEU